MTLVKKLGGVLIALVVIAFSIFGFVGCENNKQKAELSFECVSAILEKFGEDVKPFLSTLEYNYNNTENESKVKTATGYVRTLTRGMSESLKAFESVINEYNASGMDGVEITRSSGLIEIKQGTTHFSAKLSEYETDLAIMSKEGGSECLYELKAKQTGGYLAQIVSKNNGQDTYTIYQLDFNLTAGKLCIDETASAFTSIYLAELNESTYPSVSHYVFYN